MLSNPTLDLAAKLVSTILFDSGRHHVILRLDLYA